MLDPRKLAVPLFAQAGAFVVVLVIGGFTGQAKPGPPAPKSGLSSSPAASAATASPLPTASTTAPDLGAASVKLTVRVIAQGDGLSLAGRPVRVTADGGTRAPVASGTVASGTVASGSLDQSLAFAANVPRGQDEVCINPPLGWSSAVNSAQAPPGWVCAGADLRKGPQTVTFHLTSQVSQGGA